MNFTLNPKTPPLIKKTVNIGRQGGKIKNLVKD